MKTHYTPKNREFSDQCHQSARTEIYSKLYPDANITFKDTQLKQDESGQYIDDLDGFLDGKLGIDRMIYIDAPWLYNDVQITVQERFFRDKGNPSYYNQITIRERNCDSGMLGELYKLAAQLFIFGHADETTGEFKSWVVVSVEPLLSAITEGRVTWKYRYTKDHAQRFMCLDIEELEQIPGVIKKRWQGHVNN